MVPQEIVEYQGVVGAASGGPNLLGEADLVILLGAAADYRVGYLQPPGLAEGAKVVRVDVDPEQLEANGPADLAIQADPAAVLEQAYEACTEQQINGFEAWLETAQKEAVAFSKGVFGAAPRDGGLHALDLTEVMEEVLPPETVFVIDGGNIGQWFHQTLGRRRYPGHWLTCGASGGVG